MVVLCPHCDKPHATYGNAKGRLKWFPTEMSSCYREPSVAKAIVASRSGSGPTAASALGEYRAPTPTARLAATVSAPQRTLSVGGWHSFTR